MNPIAANIRRHRRDRSLTQAELAVIASVTERTIQRVEHLAEGRSPAAETLKALAAALDTDVDALRRPPAPVPPSDEERKLQESLKRYEIIKLERVVRGTDLGRVLTGVDGMTFDAGRLEDETTADVVARLHQEVIDWIDAWDDLEPLAQRDAEKAFQAALEAVHACGLAVMGAQHALRLHATGGGAPIVMTMAYVIVSKAIEARPFAVRDKSKPIRFS